LSRCPSTLRRWHRSALACLLAASVGSRSAPASAQEQKRVIVLEPAAPTALEHELLTRLTGELGAAGIQVLRVPLPAGSDPATEVATRGSELSAVAAYATREDPAAPGASVKTLRLWLADRVTGTVLAEDGQDDDASSLASSLAVQGFELLRAREAEWGWRRTAPPPPPPPPPVVPSPPTVEAELTAAMHVGLLLDAPTGGSALTPMVRVSYEPALTRALGAFDLGVRLSLAGFGAPTVVEAPDRRVDVVQSFALLEGVVMLDGGGWLHPFASAGAGAYHVDVSGVGSGPIVGRSENTMSPIGAAGFGLEVQPWRHWIGVLEAQGLFALHPTAVEASGTRAATFGRALLVFSFGLGVTW
jgi:hypothetical protein